MNSRFHAFALARAHTYTPVLYVYIYLYTFIMCMDGVFTLMYKIRLLPVSEDGA